MSDYRSVMYPSQGGLFLYSMGYEDKSKLAHWGPGARNYCILHYVTHGKGWFCGKEVRRGQGFYIHADQFHEYHADEKDGWNYFWMIFSEDLAKQYVLPYISMDENGIFEADFVEKLLLERSKIFSCRRPIPHLESLGIFFGIMALHEKRQPVGVGISASHIRSAKVLIENSFGKRLSVKEVARQLYIDDRYLYNLFKKYEGISPKEYIDRHTTENACILLTDSDMSITAVAQRLGFDDVCTFSKFFRNRTGISPLIYRRKNRA